MTKPQTIAQFFRRFPDDETCLNHLFEVRFGQGFECPKCQKASKWFRIKAERAYSCQWCGHHLHPTVGTPFEKTRTPLQLWFYAIYLFTTTRNGVAAKELERQLGVTYKTAWRMADKIREHMADVDGERPIGGIGKEVEIDETLVGGKVRGGKPGRHMENKTVVLGMVERGGQVAKALDQGIGVQVCGGMIAPADPDRFHPGSATHVDVIGGIADHHRSVRADAGFRQCRMDHRRMRL